MDFLKGKQLKKYVTDGVDGANVSNDVSADKVMEDNNVICFYFSAHWCPPCRGFTPILKTFYEVNYAYGNTR